MLQQRIFKVAVISFNDIHEHEIDPVFLYISGHV